MPRLEGMSATVGTRRRRLSLLDTMVMIAATALGMLPARWTLDQHRMTKFSNIGQRVFYAANDFLPPILAAWSLAGLVHGLAGQRLSRRAIARRPGFMACLSAVLFTVYAVAVRFSLWVLEDPDQIGQHYQNLLFTLIELCRTLHRGGMASACSHW
jgi:hypothetical protein